MSGVRQYQRKSMLDSDKERVMEYGKLGNTDIEVSKLCVGCMSF